eukprot:41540-Rhodomonas_salina.1
MSGTELVLQYSTTRCLVTWRPVGREGEWLTTTDTECNSGGILAYLSTPEGVSCRIELRTPYAMSESGIVYGAIVLRACYAVSGTETGYAATQHPVLKYRLCYYQADTFNLSPGSSLRACYAMFITHRVCSAITLRACYAMSGTHLAYGAIRRYP